MHYFKMNIGDYAKKAGRLSMLEHGAYTLLIHSCYDRERFPTLEEALEWCWVRTEEEEVAVKFVLSKFFDLVDGVYCQNRIQEEISKYHENASTNKRIATEREEKRRSKARTVHEPCSSVNEPPPNQEPLTINHKPVIKEKNNKKEKVDSIRQELSDITDQTYLDFIQLRKAKKAPLTARAIEGLRAEATKAGISLETALIECCQRGWIGFKADWYCKTSLPNSRSGSPDRDEFNKRQTEIAKQRLFGVQQEPEKDITNEAAAL